MLFVLSKKIFGLVVCLFYREHNFQLIGIYLMIAGKWICGGMIASRWFVATEGCIPSLRCP